MRLAGDARVMSTSRIGDLHPNIRGRLNHDRKCGNLGWFDPLNE